MYIVILWHASDTQNYYIMYIAVYFQFNYVQIANFSNFFKLYSAFNDMRLHSVHDVASYVCEQCETDEAKL